MADTTSLGDDERRLAELGYKQELHRSWSGFSNFAISFSIISILAGCFTTFGQAWNNGGPIAISIGWPIISVFILVIGLCMSELVSAFPTSGGIYWWASRLGGAKAGYYTGWLNLIGLIAIIASVAYGAAIFLNTFIDLFSDSYSSSFLGGNALSQQFFWFIVLMAVVTADQHLQLAPAGGHQQRLRLVARGRGGHRRPGPRSSARRATSPSRSCSPTASTTPASATARPAG